MSAEEDRLARWSRLKSEAAIPPAAEAAPAPDLADEAFVAALPKIEEIDAATDIRGFLRAGVPLALRNAALARMWSADAAIRDRIPDAVDYWEDYNAPHMISGWGGACPQEAQAFVERTLEPRLREPEPTTETGRIATAENEEPLPSTEPEAAPGEEAPPESRSAPAKVAKFRARHGGALPEPG